MVSSRSMGHDRADWRWARAAVIHDQSTMKATARLLGEDPLVGEAVRFKQWFKGNLGHEEYSNIRAAHQIFLNDPFQKMYMEAWLLAGAENEVVADQLWCAPEVVQWYHDLFFDVREGLRRPSWVCATIFRGAPHRGLHKTDQHGLHLRLAWLGGLETLKLYIQSKTFDSASVKLIRELMRANLLKCGVDLSFNSGMDADSATFVIALLNEGDQDQSAGKSVIADHIAQLISETSSLIGLAPPDAARNLTLSAREPRVYEQLGEPEPASR